MTPLIPCCLPVFPEETPPLKGDVITAVIRISFIGIAIVLAEVPLKNHSTVVAYLRHALSIIDVLQSF
jgi:hypothetical protein